RFKIEDALTSDKVRSLRNAVINFIVGGTIRQMQERQKGRRRVKYSFIVHTERGKESHEWQETVVRELKEYLRQAVDKDPVLLDDLLAESYENLKGSITALDCYTPPFSDVRYEIIKSLKRDYLRITTVNSEKDVSQLLDETGQLKLRT